LLSRHVLAEPDSFNPRHFETRPHASVQAVASTTGEPVQVALGIYAIPMQLDNAKTTWFVVENDLVNAIWRLKPTPAAVTLRATALPVEFVQGRWKILEKQSIIRMMDEIKQDFRAEIRALENEIDAARKELLTADSVQDVDERARLADFRRYYLPRLEGKLAARERDLCKINLAALRRLDTEIQVALDAGKPLYRSMPGSAAEIKAQGIRLTTSLMETYYYQDIIRHSGSGVGTGGAVLSLTTSFNVAHGLLHGKRNCLVTINPAGHGSDFISAAGFILRHGKEHLTKSNKGALKVMIKFALIAGEQEIFYLHGAIPPAMILDVMERKPYRPRAHL
jgi:hypothetical protein